MRLLNISIILTFIILILTSCSPKAPSALLYASKAGDLKKVIKLLSDGYDISYYEEEGLRPIHLASLYGHANVVKFLLSKGADISANAIQGQTPLILAVKSGNIDTVKVLLENKADVNYLAENGTALKFALMLGRYKIADLLIENGADINKSNINNPLYFSFSNKLDTLKYLITKGTVRV